ncbi:ImmA/IrrE family metallo-endopeptidase [Paenibacillus senegalensis]|uniref:ImmA/IrrE family metallo-endopeptidase n=1 Tax=Paenibacillus senegalensis TaxID=1465766 RepID=UPI0002895F67|nr:ImmA/IrrE family metallo-endopeptidase [Paenibacillus senegalensis]
MLANYKCTPFEQWIEDVFLRYSIIQPQHLCIDYVARKFNIWVYYRKFNSAHFQLGRGLYSVNIDARLTKEEQWEDFLHELCHVLRHEGNQLVMAESFRRWQEQDANHFVPYAAMPFFMLKRLEIPQQKEDILDLFIHTFKVTRTLAEKRLEQIQRRILQTVWDEEWKKRCEIASVITARRIPASVCAPVDRKLE